MAESEPPKKEAEKGTNPDAFEKTRWLPPDAVIVRPPPGAPASPDVETALQAETTMRLASLRSEAGHPAWRRWVVGTLCLIGLAALGLIGYRLTTLLAPLLVTRGMLPPMAAPSATTAAAPPPAVALPPSPSLKRPPPLPAPEVQSPLPPISLPVTVPESEATAMAVPFLGVVVSDMSYAFHYFDQPGDAGAVVVAVYPRSPAADAGIREGDLILAVDGQAVLTAMDLSSTTWEIGDVVVLEVQGGPSRRAQPARVRLRKAPPDYGTSEEQHHFYSERITRNPRNPFNYYYRATLYAAVCLPMVGVESRPLCTTEGEAQFFEDMAEGVRLAPEWPEAQAAYAEAQLMVWDAADLVSAPIPATK